MMTLALKTIYKIIKQFYKIILNEFKTYFYIDFSNINTNNLMQRTMYYKNMAEK
jgi:hypothetical protein